MSDDATNKKPKHRRISVDTSLLQALTQLLALIEALSTKHGQRIGYVEMHGDGNTGEMFEMLPDFGFTALSLTPAEQPPLTERMRLLLQRCRRDMPRDSPLRQEVDDLLEEAASLFDQ